MDIVKLKNSSGAYVYPVSHTSAIKVNGEQKTLTDKLEQIVNDTDVYNVTEQVPLQTGYYILNTAISAIPQDIRKLGLIITYQIDTGQWETKQFIGSNVSGWSTESNWTDFGSVIASRIVFDNSSSDLVSTNVQEAIKEVHNNNIDVVVDKSVNLINLNDSDVIENNYISVSNSTPSEINHSGNDISGYIMVKANTVYTFRQSGTYGRTLGKKIPSYDISSKAFLSYITGTWVDENDGDNFLLEFTPTANCYIRLSIQHNKDVMLVEGASTDYPSEYVEYFYTKRISYSCLPSQLLDEIEDIDSKASELKDKIEIVIKYDISDCVQNSYWNLRDKNVGDTYSGASIELEGSYYKLDRLTLSEGETITIATKGSSAGARGWAMCSLNNIILDIAPAPSDTLANPYEYTATEDCYVYINSIVNQVKIEIKKTKDRITLIEENLTELNNNIEEVDTLSEDVAEIKNDIYGTNTLLEPINTLSEIVISTSGVLTETSGDFKTRVFEVSEGDVLHYVLERNSYSTGTRKSGSFYYTEDDVNYTLISYNQFPNWVKNETQSLDFYVTVPSGVNRAAMYAGNIENRIVIQDVYKVVKSDLQNVMEEVDAYPNTELNNRLAILESDASIGGASKIVNLSPNFSKSNLRVLSIGNSFTANSLYYLDELVTAAGITLYDTNWSYYAATRGGATFKTWYDVWYNNNLYSSVYGIAKKAGATIDYGGGSREVMPDNVYQNGEEFRNLIKNGNWDLIIIQQKSDFNNDYTLYEGDSNGGYLKEFINLLKTYNPNASIGYMNPQASPQNNPNTIERWGQMADTTKWMQTQYGVDFVIPIATAIENIRQSSIAANATHKLTEDNHHLANGLGKYVSAATLFQTLIGNRYGISVYGNSFRTAAGEAASGYESDYIDVLTDNVAHTAQMAALLACSNMYEIRNPDNYTLDV